MELSRVRISVIDPSADFGAIVEVESDGAWWPVATEQKPWVLRLGIVVLLDAPAGTMEVAKPNVDDFGLKIPNAVRSFALAAVVDAFEAVRFDADPSVGPLRPGGPPVELSALYDPSAGE